MYLLNVKDTSKLFKWATMWRSLLIFRSQSGSASRNVWETVGTRDKI